MLTLSAKPDIEEAILRWRHFWNGELLKRPVVLASVLKDGSPADEEIPLNKKRYYNALNGLWEEQLGLIDRRLERTCFPGEHMPMFGPDLGPDQWAAFFGAEFKFSKGDLSTNWVEPVVDDWQEALPLELDPANASFLRMLGYAEFLARRGEGRFLVSHIDAHSNADALSALRGPMRFMTDLYDCPGLVERAMADIRRSYKPVNEAVIRAAGMGGARGQGQGGLWHEKSFQFVQSDVICMLSPEHFRKFVMPALEEEFACHEGVFFHLDGPGALKHLDDILSIPGRWILQWVPGAGCKPNWQWAEIHRKAQDAGKSVIIYGSGLGPEQIKQIHPRLDPARVIYSPEVKTEREARELIGWLEKNS